MLAAAVCVLVLTWPVLNSGGMAPLPIPALRAAQVLLVLSGAGVVVVAVHAAGTARDRRWLAALGLVLVGACVVTVLAMAVGAGLLLPDATY